MECLEIAPSQQRVNSRQRLQWSGILKSGEVYEVTKLDAMAKAMDKGPVNKVATKGEQRRQTTRSDEEGDNNGKSR